MTYDVGCEPCDCHMNSSSCDPDTGDCECEPGYTGRRCDVCIEHYYYDIEHSGCISQLNYCYNLFSFNNFYYVIYLILLSYLFICLY